MKNMLSAEQLLSGRLASMAIGWLERVALETVDAVN